MIIILPSPEVKAGHVETKTVKFHQPSPFELPLGEESGAVFGVDPRRPFEIYGWYKSFDLLQKKGIGFESRGSSFGVHLPECGTWELFFVDACDNKP